jgi:hypothetical protein
MLDEKEEKSRNLERMRAAYKANFYGDSPEVLNGTAADMIESFLADKGGDSSKTGMKRKTEKSGNDKNTRTRKADGQKSLHAYIQPKSL